LDGRSRHRSRSEHPAGYLANVEFVDEGVGTVLDSLKAQGVMDDFLIIWATDHGDMNGDHYLWRKGYPWEASSHMPLVIRTPGGSEVKESDAIVEVRDVTATIYDVAGVLDSVRGADPLMNGQSVLPIMLGDEDKVRDHLDLEHSQVYNATIHWNAIVGDDEETGGRYKFIFNAFEGTEQLFDLREDPGEAVDLVLWGGEDVQDGVLKRFRQIMVKQFEDEGRGDDWVKDGELMVRKWNVVFGANYPCA
jgi:arylsulfatase A-like enzyme